MSLTKPEYYDNTYETSTGDVLETIDVINTSAFTLGNVFKYIVRHNDKGGKDDIEKALEYLRINEDASTKANLKYVLMGDGANAMCLFILDGLSKEEKKRLSNNGADLALSFTLLYLSQLVIPVNKHPAITFLRNVLITELLKLINDSSLQSSNVNVSLNDILKEENKEIYKFVCEIEDLFNMEYSHIFSEPEEENIENKEEDPIEALVKAFTDILRDNRNLLNQEKLLKELFKSMSS